MVAGYPRVVNTLYAFPLAKFSFVLSHTTLLWKTAEPPQSSIISEQLLLNGRWLPTPKKERKNGPDGQICKLHAEMPMYSLSPLMSTVTWTSLQVENMHPDWDNKLYVFRYCWNCPFKMKSVLCLWNWQSQCQTDLHSQLVMLLFFVFFEVVVFGTFCVTYTIWSSF